MKFSHFSFLALALALVHVHAQDSPPDAVPGPQVATGGPTEDGSSFPTDIKSIEATALKVDQTSGVDPTAAPNQPPAETEVTAVDGELTDAGTSSQRRSLSGSAVAAPVWEPRFNKGNVVQSRGVNDYIKVFEASTAERDASIQGTAYLTYKLVSNSTYNVNDCLAFCDSVRECRFVNLYYEFNNALYDWVFSEKSNLVCAIYGDVHTAAEKTNFAGQQLKPSPEPLTRITRSTGWAKEAPLNPSTPEGYSLSFGPISLASGGGIFLGSQTISTYDVSACASLCNNLVVDAQVKAQLGACQSFNIWRSLVDKMPTTYTCQFYAAPITASGATYSGNAGLKLEVTMSRGYNRINSIVNGKLRNFNNWLVGTPRLGDTSSIYDIGRTVGHGDSGTYFSGFTKWFTTQETPGSLKTANRISTIPGRRYTLQLWYRQDTSLNTFVLKWNGVSLNGVASPMPANAPNFSLLTLQVVGTGSDTFEFFGGGWDQYTYISDISLFLS